MTIVRAVGRNFGAGARVGLGVLLVVIALSIAIPWLGPYRPTIGGAQLLSHPTLSHLFGTDELGRDVFTRTFAAARIDIAVAVLGVTIPLVTGTLIGAVLGYSPSGAAHVVGGTLIDAINAFPFLVLVISLVTLLGAGVTSILVSISAVNWARYARLATSRARILRGTDFIHAARVLGYSRRRILLRHIVPNLYAEAAAYGLSDFVLVIATVTGLSFLGIGINPPTPEWGAMMAAGRAFLPQAWWIVVFPGIVLSVVAASVATIASDVLGHLTGNH